jgi:hypothetical protein
MTQNYFHSMHSLYVIRSPFPLHNWKNVIRVEKKRLLNLLALEPWKLLLSYYVVPNLCARIVVFKCMPHF